MSIADISKHKLLPFMVTLIALFIFGAACDAIKDDDPNRPLKDFEYRQQNVAKAMQLLDNTALAVRADAIRNLTKIGKESRSAIPRLIELLGTETTPQQSGLYLHVIPPSDHNVILCLARMESEPIAILRAEFPTLSNEAQLSVATIAYECAPKAQSLLTLFVKRLENEESEDARIVLLRAIAVNDPRGIIALPVVLKRLQTDPSDRIRLCAAGLLGNVKDTEDRYWMRHTPATGWVRHTPKQAVLIADGLLSALNDPSPLVRVAAASWLLGYSVVEQRAIPALIKLLDDRASYHEAISDHFGHEVTVGFCAARCLVHYSNHADLILPHLAKFAAQNGLHSLIPIDPNQFALLASRAKNPQPELTNLLDCDGYKLAMYSLAKLGPNAKWSIQKLEELASKSDEESADWAKIVLNVIDPADHSASSSDLESFVNGDLHDACHFFQFVGRPGAFAIPVLMKHLKDESGDVDWMIMEALLAIGVDKNLVLPILMQKLDEDFVLNRYYQRKAWLALGEFAVAPLIDVLKKSQNQRQKQLNCLRILAAFGTRAADAVPEILPLLTSETPKVRIEAIEFLGNIAARPDVSIVALQKMLKDARPAVRIAAATSCGNFNTSAATAVPQLTKALVDEYLDVRLAAALALARIGPAALPALDGLKKMTASDNTILQEAAQDAIQAISGR